MTNLGERSPAVVIGAGPAGVAAALHLARSDIPVLVIERGDGTGNPIGETLAPSATPLLHTLGLYDAFLSTSPLPSHANRSSWGGDGAVAEHDFLRQPHGPGWHLDRPAFNAALLGAAVAAGAVCWRQTRFRGAERDNGSCWRIDVEDAQGTPRNVRADLVVDASGRQSVFARRQGARRSAFDRLVAAVATLRPSGAPMRDSATLVEATEGGWWYSALLPDGCLATAYFSDPDLLAVHRPWRPAGWRALLESSVHTRTRIEAHAYASVAPVQIAAAGSVRLSPPCGDGWIAVGDAAAAFDPLSSHGIGSALANGRQAATAAAAYLGGQPAALRDYAERLAAGYATYLAMWQAYYAEERRWPEAPFWRRRAV